MQFDDFEPAIYCTRVVGDTTTVGFSETLAYNPLPERGSSDLQQGSYHCSDSGWAGSRESKED
jgi:hypothetical protein